MLSNRVQSPLQEVSGCLVSSDGESNGASLNTTAASAAMAGSDNLAQGKCAGLQACKIII